MSFITGPGPTTSSPSRWSGQRLLDQFFSTCGSRGHIGRANLDGTDKNHGFHHRALAVVVAVAAITAITAATAPAATAATLEPTSVFGKVKKNKRDGRAKLTVNVSGGGDLALAKTEKVRAAGVRAEVAGKGRAAH